MQYPVLRFGSVASQNENMLFISGEIIGNEVQVILRFLTTTVHFICMQSRNQEAFVGICICHSIYARSGF